MDELTKVEPSDAQTNRVQDSVQDPVQASDAVPDGDVDPQVIVLALATGGKVLDFVVRGDEDGLMQFFNEIRQEITRQKRLAQLLQMEQDDLERLLQSLPSTPSEPSTASKPVGENSPVQQLFSPAERTGRKNVSGARSLWEHFNGG